MERLGEIVDSYTPNGGEYRKISELLRDGRVSVNGDKVDGRVVYDAIIAACSSRERVLGD